MVTEFASTVKKKKKKKVTQDIEDCISKDRLHYIFHPTHSPVCDSLSSI